MTKKPEKIKIKFWAIKSRDGRLYGDIFGRIRFFRSRDTARRAKKDTHNHLPDDQIVRVEIREI